MFPNFHKTGALFTQTTKALVNDLGRNELTLAALDMGLQFQYEVSPGPFENQAAAFLIRMSEQHRVPELIGFARSRNTRNPNLKMIETKVAEWWNQAFGTALNVDVASGAYQLQSFIRPHLGTMSMDDWIDRAIVVRKAVCRIEAGRQNGTGFLVGKDFVLTARHVIAGHEDATCIFDDDDDSSETVQKPAARIQEGNGELSDWALLRLDEAFSDRAPLGLATGASRTGDPLIVLQHPGGGKKRISQGSVKAVPDPILLSHDANTEPGASGGPCCNAHWQVVAIHREGKDGNRNRAVAIGPVVNGLPVGTLPA